MIIPSDFNLLYPSLILRQQSHAFPPLVLKHLLRPLLE